MQRCSSDPRQSRNRFLAWVVVAVKLDAGEQRSRLWSNTTSASADACNRNVIRRDDRGERERQILRGAAEGRDRLLACWGMQMAFKAASQGCTLQKHLRDFEIRLSVRPAPGFRW